MEVDAHPIRRDPGGGVYDDVWIVPAAGARLRVMADEVVLILNPPFDGEWTLPDPRYRPSIAVTGAAWSFSTQVGTVEVSTAGVVTVALTSTPGQRSAYLTWPLRGSETGDAPA